MSSLTQKLLQLVEAFPKAQVLVVGDLILDTYLECQAIGVATEAPVPFWKYRVRLTPLEAPPMWRITWPD